MPCHPLFDNSFSTRVKGIPKNSEVSTTHYSSRPFASSPPWTVRSSSATKASSNRRSRKLAPGLGARHTAAAAITARAPATSVVVSASSGTVTVYRDGRTILELERPHPTIGATVTKAKG